MSDEYLYRYTITLTENDVYTIALVGQRYSWSHALGGLSEGVNDLAEHEAWAIRDAFEADTEGGHSMFPMLDEESELYVKLMKFYDEVV